MASWSGKKRGREKRGVSWLRPTSRKELGIFCSTYVIAFNARKGYKREGGRACDNLVGTDASYELEYDGHR